MFSSNCVQILKNVDSSELKDIASFVKKKLSTTNKEYALFKYLKECHPEYNEETLDFETIHKKIYGKQQVKNPDKNLSNIGLKVNAVLEEYLLDSALKRNPQEKEFLLSSEYSRLGLRDQLDKTIDAYFPEDQKESPKSKSKDEVDLQENAETNSKTTKKEKLLHIWHFWHLHRLLHLRYYSRGTVQNSAGETSLVRSLEQLNLANIAAKLRIVHEMEVMKKIHGRVPSAFFSDVEKELIRSNATPANPFILLYHHAYELALFPSDKRYYILKWLLKVFGDKLIKDDRGNLTRSLINYASEAIRNGHHKFYDESFELHKEGIDNESLLQDGKITPEVFLNIINIVCEQKDIDEAKRLLIKYEPLLPNNLRDEAIIVLSGRVFFYNKEYANGYGQFTKITTYTNRLMELTARCTLLQCYYEAGEYAALVNACHSFQKAIDRSEKRFSDNYRKSFGNFSKMVATLSKIKIDPDGTFDREKIKDKMNGYNVLVCKKWLIEKIENFKV
ncbi:hypothetical protein [Haliscomenobacter sp.]|uniref:hypothetical protein n=1 Tax=Haliscomenobacter sp. TaxID=2717303 RepID=UPI003364ED35